MTDTSTDDGVPCQQGCGGSDSAPAYPTFLVEFPSGSQRGFWDEENATYEANAYDGKIVAKVNPDTGNYEPYPPPAPTPAPSKKAPAPPA